MTAQEEVQDITEAMKNASVQEAPKEDVEEKKPDYSVPGPAQPADWKIHEKKLQKMTKLGGKRGVEIEGAADMGGLKFFCTDMKDFPADGKNVLLSLMEQTKAMNEVSDPTEEERKGGAGNLGKMVFTCYDNASEKDVAPQLQVIAYIPKQLEDVCNAKTWLQEALRPCLPDGQSKYVDEVKGCEGCEDKNWATFYMKGTKEDAENGVFALKLRDPMLSNAYNYLRKNKDQDGNPLFPEDDDEDDDEMVFGDDDFDQFM